MTVATEILNQLGGQQFLAMTGSHSLMSDEGANWITMRLRTNKAKAQYLKVELTDADTYNVHFFSLKRKTLDRVTRSEHKGVYNDMLRKLFTDVTGLYTKL